VGVVKPLAPHLPVQPRDFRDGLLSSVTAAFLAGEGPLRCREPVGGRREMARVRHVHAVAGGQERRHAQVDADGRPGWLQRLGGHVVARQHHVPVIAFPFGGNGLDASVDGAVLVGADMADAFEVDAGDLGMRNGVPSGSVLLPPFDGIPPAAPLEPRVARLLPGLDALEEALESVVQAAERGPLAVIGPALVPFRVLCSDLLQLGVLAVEGDLVAAHPPRLTPLFKRRVVQLPGVLQAGVQRGLLLPGGPQPELVSAPHVSSSNDRRITAISS
jgi:hypothetical protein